MDLCMLVLVTSTILKEGLTTRYSRRTELNWCKANEYCNDRNSSLILLNSQNRWNDFISNGEISPDQSFLWTGLRLDSYQCTNTSVKKWSYDGWTSWVVSREPDNCPDHACVVANKNGMRTRSCEDRYKPLCRKDVPTTTQSTYSSVATPYVKTTTQSTHSAVGTSDVKTTTQSTHTDVVTSDVKTATQRTRSAVVVAGGKTTTQSTHSAEVTSDFRTTTQSTTTAGATADVPTMSTNVVPTAYNSTLVDGSCKECCVKNNRIRQLSHEELKSVIQELKSQLAVNKNNLSTNRRKLISVYDSRPSSVAMGGVAIAIMIVIPGIIVIPDMVNLVRFMYRRQKKHLL